MKKFTQVRLFSSSLSFLLVAMLLVSSCSSPQHFSFSAAPPSYQKVKKAPATPEVVTEVETPTLTASTAEEAIVLPEIAALKKETAKAVATAKETKTEVKPAQKLNLAQKVVLKKLQKQVTKLERKSESSNQEVLKTAAGPVSNRSAIALILIGLVIALFGALLGGVFYTLGTLVILIGLVLLILNYI